MHTPNLPHHLSVIIFLLITLLVSVYVCMCVCVCVYLYKVCLWTCMHAHMMFNVFLSVNWFTDICVGNFVCGLSEIQTHENAHQSFCYLISFIPFLISHKMDQLVMCIKQGN